MGTERQSVTARPQVNIGTPDGGVEGTVLFVHGTLDSSASFRRGPERFLHRWTTLTYDRRGWGRSRSGGLAACRLSTHVSDLLDVLMERPPDIVVGHSYGGLIALNAAAIKPSATRALVVYEPPVRWLPWWPEEAPWEQLVREVSAEDPASVASRMRGAVLGRDIPRATNRFREAELEDGRSLMTEMTDSELNEASFEPLTFSVPLISAAGGQSLHHHQHAAQRLAELVPKGAYVELPKAAHIAHITHPEAFSSLVLRAEEFASGLQPERNAAVTVSGS